MKRISRLLLLMGALTAGFSGAAGANVVTDWNQILFEAALADGTNPLFITRVSATVQASVFDAVNGIARKYDPIHVAPAAPRGASRRAAAVQAAYVTLSFFYPAQQAMLDAKRTASLAAIHTSQKAKEKGIAWGQTVADAMLAWRSTDGITPPAPPFLGGSDPGQWRPTMPAFIPGVFPEWATMVTWSIESPSQFRPAGPPALGSARYASDFSETQLVGSLTSAVRTSDQTLFSEFWASSTASYYWNQVAIALDHRHNSVLKKARLLALLNVAMADAAIACWDAKYTYTFWRPVTAIGLQDPSWTPLLFTPPHPEYPSGHSSFSGAAASVLRDRFGEHTAFSVTSDVMLGVVRSFANFSSALEEIKDARIYAGIHFRSACDDGDETGNAVAQYVVSHTAQPVCDEEGDDDGGEN